MKNNSTSMQVWLCVLTTAFFFGTMEIALKLAGSQFDPIQLTFLRFLIGGLILLPFGLRDMKKREIKLTASDYIYLVILGIVCVCFSMCLFQFGLQHTNASLAAVIISINPVFTMIFAHFMTEDKFTYKKLVVLVISVIGLIIVANPFSLGEGNEPIGIAMVMVASMAFGLYTAMGKRRIGKIGGMTQNALCFIFGAAILLVVMLFCDIPILGGVNADSIWLVIYVSFFVTGLGYFCFGRALELSDPSTASIAFFIKPILAMVLAYFILHENITANMLVGFAIVLLGSGINIFWKK